MMTVSKDRVEPSPYPTKWLLTDVFVHAIVFGIYSALSTVAFFLIIVKTTFFQDKFGVETIHYRPLDGPNPGWNDPVLHSIIYLQTSILSQALIFVTRSRSFFFLDRPSFMLVFAFALGQIIATIIAVYANWGFANVAGCGWAWAGIIWIWNIIWFFPFDLLKVFNSKNERTSTKILFCFYKFSLLWVFILIQRKKKLLKKAYSLNHQHKNNVHVVEVP
jgi:H+-transporting ATPase